MSEIDHARVMDGHQQLVGFTSYIAFETFCGICDEPTVLSPAVPQLSASLWGKGRGAGMRLRRGRG